MYRGPINFLQFQAVRAPVTIDCSHLPRGGYHVLEQFVQLSEAQRDHLLFRRIHVLWPNGIVSSNTFDYCCSIGFLTASKIFWHANIFLFILQSTSFILLS